MLLKEIKTIFQKELAALYPKEEIDTFFYAMVEHYLGLQRFVLVVTPNITLTKEEEQPLFEGLTRLRLEEPLQYILGETHFRDLVLEVNTAVLIPRPETEELVDWVVQEWGNREEASPVILDIGTGSGCIAIALAKALPSAKVVALDISEKALEVAVKNATRNEVEVTFILANILDFDTMPERAFDVIISNPPYVRVSEKPEIRNNVKKYEPEQALFVSDEHPLLHYKAIARFAHQHLKKEGSLFLEINQYLGKETKAFLEENYFTKVELKKDIFGKDRMLKALKE